MCWWAGNINPITKKCSQCFQLALVVLCKYLCNATCICNRKRKKKNRYMLGKKRRGTTTNNSDACISPGSGLLILPPLLDALSWEHMANQCPFTYSAGFQLKQHPLGNQHSQQLLALFLFIHLLFQLYQDIEKEGP